MKFVILFAFVFALALARPDVKIIKSKSDVQPDQYSFDVKTSDANNRHEGDVSKYVDSEHPAIVVSGSFSYMDEHGKRYSLNYEADKNDFKPPQIASNRKSLI